MFFQALPTPPVVCDMSMAPKQNLHNHPFYEFVHLLPEQQNNGAMGVAFVEAENRQDAMYTFMQQYRGQYWTVDSCTKVF